MSLTGLVTMVQTFAEEFGPQNVLIALPMEWAVVAERLTSHELMRLYFTTNDRIEVSVYEGIERKIHYSTDAEQLVQELLSADDFQTTI